MSRPMRVLLVDDEPAQAWLVAEYLRAAAPGTVTLETAETLTDGLGRLAATGHDALLLDLCLPDCLGVETYRRVAERFPLLPVVVLTSLEDEDLGSQLVQMGAQDYLVKGQIGGPMLVRTLRYAVERRRAQAEREELIERLQSALDEVHRLEGLLPICAWCNKIRDDEGYWQSVEVFIAERTGARFSHGICPSCMKTVCPDETVTACWLTPLDVTDAGALLAHLQAANDPVSGFLREHFHGTTVDRIDQCRPDAPVDKALVEALVGELNRLLERAQLYSPERFAQVELSPETVAEARSDDSRDLARRIRINRQLLQAAFPSCLSPTLA